MKDNIRNALEFLSNLFDRLLYFTILMCVITIISIAIISIFNEDIISKIFFINLFIGLTPVVIDLLLIIILYLIYRIIYGWYAKNDFFNAIEGYDYGIK